MRMNSKSLFVLIIITIVYSLIVHFFAKEKRWDWWNTFIATIISVVGAMIVGIWLYNQQVNSDNVDNANKYKILLTQEISQILYFLENSYANNCVKIHTADGKKFRVSCAYIQPLVLEDAARSGLFEGDISVRMLICAQEIRMHNERFVNFNSYANSPSDSKLKTDVEELSKDMENLRKDIITNLKELSDKMKLPVQQFITDYFISVTTTSSVSKAVIKNIAT